MRLLRLTGRHAVGVHQFAIVDNADFDELSRFRWKAKPNAAGNGTYAVRNVKRDGRNTMLRMHRAVLGYDGPLDVRHLNGNKLDNRRENLQVAPRSQTVAQGRCRVVRGTCEKCGQAFERIVLACARARLCMRCTGRRGDTSLQGEVRLEH
jgi:hypothetical protein